MSATLDILTAIQQSAVGRAVAKSDHLVGATAQLFHVLGFILLLASIVLTNLRLLGYGLRDKTARELAREGSPLVWLGLASAVLSGLVMFFSAVELYYFNPAFKLKIGLLILAIALQLTWFRKVLATDSVSPAVARASALVSLFFWFGVGIAGRAIGFV